MDNQIMRTRDLSFDILRAVATLWIVGVWHLLSQTGLSNLSDWALGWPITNTCLACFIFISGYFLSKYTFDSRRDITFFLKKRFVRFYILFFISTASLLAAGYFFGFHWFSNVRQFLLCITGLSTFFPPRPSTFWFISLLMILYISTPFVLYKKSTNVNRVTIKVVLLLLLTLILILCGLDVDEHFFSYVIWYYAAILVPHDVVSKFKTKHWLMVPAIICWLGISMISSQLDSDGPTLSWNGLINQILIFVYELFGIVFLIIFSDFLAKVLPGFLKKLFSFIAFASMAMYLFHRHVYVLGLALFEKANIPINYVVCYLLLLPITIVVGWCIQKLYDSILDKLAKS